jgi:hypothetical protein
MTAATERPSAPTVPMPRPDPEAALLAAMEREAAAVSERTRAAAQCSPAQQARALCRFRRLRGWCVDCGNAALAGEARCMTCELAAVQG